MRILVISHEYPPVGGGGGKVAQDLSCGFAQAGHEVHVLTAHFGDLPLQDTDHGVMIQRVHSLRRKMYQASFLTMLGFIVSAGGTLIRNMKKWHPDIVHIHFAVPAGPLGWLSNKLFAIPYVLTIHLGDIPGGTPEKTARWFKFVYPFTPPIWRRAAKVVAVSQFSRNLGHISYDVPIQVIHNGVILDPIFADQLSVGKPPQIIFAARFSEQKNPLIIVKILSQLTEFAWHCTMFGDGELFNAVMDSIDKAGLQNRFTLPGWVSPQIVHQQLLKSDILVMPSLSEGLPVVGLRALSAGLCCVVSKIGGFSDLVNDGFNGYLLPPNNEALWVEKIKGLLNNHELLLQYRRNSLQKAAEFDLHDSVARYLQIFEEVIQFDHLS